MADFTSGVSPVEPEQAPNVVVPASTADANAILSAGNILGAVGSSLAQGYTAAQNTKQLKENARITNQFSQNLLRISDLEQQGYMKPDVAMRQYRLEMARTLSNNPMMEKELLQTYASIVGTPGLGQNIAKDFQQAKDNQNDLVMQNLKDAQAKGWGKASDPPDVQQYWADKHQEFLKAQDDMEAANAILEHKIKENNLVTSGLSITSARNNIALQGISMQRQRLGLAQDYAQNQFLQGVKGLSDSYFPKYSRTLSDLLADVRAGKMTKEDAISQVQAQFAQMQQQVSSISLAHKEPGSIDAFMKPFEMMTQRTLDQLSGKTLSTVATNDVGNIQALQQLQLLTHDPKFLTLTGVSKLIPAGAGALQDAIGNSAIDLLKKGGVIQGEGQAPPNPVTDGTPESAKGTKQYFDMLKRAMIVARSGNDAELNSEVDTNVANILRGVSVYGSTAQNPSDMTQVVRYLASPEFGEYMKTHPDAVTGPNARKAEEVYISEYQNKVLPLVQEEFINTGADFSTAYTQTGSRMSDASPGLNARTGGRSVPVMEPNAKLIHPEFNGVGVTFVATADSNNPSVQAKVKKLNAQVAPAMNTMIRANAHLAGSTNYKQAYEQLMSQLSSNIQNEGE